MAITTHRRANLRLYTHIQNELMLMALMSIVLMAGKVRFTFNKERSKELNRDHSADGTVKEFIPNKKVSYTWQHKDTPEFFEATVTWELEEIDGKQNESGASSFRLYRKEEGKLSFTEHDKG